MVLSNAPKTLSDGSTRDGSTKHTRQSDKLMVSTTKTKPLAVSGLLGPINDTLNIYQLSHFSWYLCYMLSQFVICCGLVCRISNSEGNLLIQDSVFNAIRDYNASTTTLTCWRTYRMVEESLSSDIIVANVLEILLMQHMTRQKYVVPIWAVGSCQTRNSGGIWVIDFEAPIWCRLAFNYSTKTVAAASNTTFFDDDQMKPLTPPQESSQHSSWFISVEREIKQTMERVGTVLKDSQQRVLQPTSKHELRTKLANNMQVTERLEYQELASQHNVDRLFHLASIGWQ